MTNEVKRNEDTVEPLVRLSEFDRIVTAYARKASGPGWSNRPLWVVVEDRRTGKMREECIQPQQQSEEVWRLYDIASEVDAALYAAVKRMLSFYFVEGKDGAIVCGGLGLKNTLSAAHKAVKKAKRAKIKPEWYIK